MMVIYWMPLIGVNRLFDTIEIFVSKNDLENRITYCNQKFMKLGGNLETEPIGEVEEFIETIKKQDS